MRQWLPILFTMLFGCAESPSPVTTETPPRGVVEAHLSAAQRQAVDVLVDLTAERLRLMHDVARYKWNHDLPIERPEREAELLAKLVQQGTDAGVPKHIVTAFFERQFAAAKALQQKYFTKWASNDAGRFDDVPDLATAIRPEIDRLSTEMIAQLVVLEPVWDERELRTAIEAAIDARDDALDDFVREALGTGD